MKRLIAATLLLGMTAAQAETLIAPSQARRHVGQQVTVRGSVDGVHDTRKVIYLYMGGRAPRNALSIAIYPAAVQDFNNSVEFPGKSVEVSGVVRLQNGKPQIDVNTPHQIFVKD